MFVLKRSPCPARRSLFHLLSKTHRPSQVQSPWNVNAPAVYRKKTNSPWSVVRVWHQAASSTCSACSVQVGGMLGRHQKKTALPWNQQRERYTYIYVCVYASTYNIILYYIYVCVYPCVCVYDITLVAQILLYNPCPSYIVCVKKWMFSGIRSSYLLDAVIKTLDEFVWIWFMFDGESL